MPGPLVLSGSGATTELRRPCRPPTLARDGVLFRTIGDEHLGEIEACLSAKAAAALASDLGRDLADEQLAEALMAYAETYVRALLDQGEDLSDHSLIIEVDSEDRNVLRPYLPS